MLLDLGKDDAATAASGSDLMGRINVRAPSRPALHAAAKLGNLVDLTRAIEATAIGEVDKKNLGYSAIHLAAKGGHCEALSQRLESKSDLHARAANGTTALHCAADSDAARASSARNAAVLFFASAIALRSAAFFDSDADSFSSLAHSSLAADILAASLDISASFCARLPPLLRVARGASRRL